MANRNQLIVNQARGALDQLKFEVAQQLGISLDPAYNGDKQTREMGAIGGNMVRRMVQMAQQQLSQEKTASPSFKDGAIYSRNIRRV